MIFIPKSLVTESKCIKLQLTILICLSYIFVLRHAYLHKWTWFKYYFRYFFCLFISLLLKEDYVILYQCFVYCSRLYILMLIVTENGTRIWPNNLLKLWQAFTVTASDLTLWVAPELLIDLKHSNDAFLKWERYSRAFWKYATENWSMYFMTFSTVFF